MSDITLTAKTFVDSDDEQQVLLELSNGTSAYAARRRVPSHKRAQAGHDDWQAWELWDEGDTDASDETTETFRGFDWQDAAEQALEDDHAA